MQKTFRTYRFCSLEHKKVYLVFIGVDCFLPRAVFTFLNWCFPKIGLSLSLLRYLSLSLLTFLLSSPRFVCLRSSPFLSSSHLRCVLLRSSCLLSSKHVADLLKTLNIFARWPSLCLPLSFVPFPFRSSLPFCRFIFFPSPLSASPLFSSHLRSALL